VCDEHTVTAITEAILSSITVGFEPPGTRGHMVMVCAEGEWHGLPAKMAAELFTLQGWRVTFLGAAMPATHLRRYLADSTADVVSVSCTLASNLPGAARSIAVARQLGFHVLSGGRAFGSSPARARAVGANGWADTSTPYLDVEASSFLRASTVDDDAPWAEIDRGQLGLVRTAMAWLAQQPIGNHELEAMLDDLADDLTVMMRTVAAAEICSEPAILADHIGWLSVLESTGARARGTMRWLARAAAAAVEPIAPAAADELLRSLHG
jgi:hypothetical protein